MKAPVYTSNSENTTDVYTQSKNVYTPNKTYIRENGDILLKNGTSKNPTDFFNLLRNAHNRGYDRAANRRRQELLEHLNERFISPQTIKLIKLNTDIVGDEVLNKLREIQF